MEKKKRRDKRLVDNIDGIVKELLIRINITEDSILGILIYGSNVTNHSDKFSDLDILIVIDDNCKKNGRGVLNVLGERVEYFVMRELDVYKEQKGHVKNAFYISSNCYILCRRCYLWYYFT